MSFENLICPQCKYQLQAPASQTQVCCPRCSTWLELEARCNGVCLSCHAAPKAENTGSCADLAAEQIVTIEKNTAKSSANPEESKNKAGRSGLKALFKRVFHV